MPNAHTVHLAYVYPTYKSMKGSCKLIKTEGNLIPEICHSGLKNHLILIAGDVYGDKVSDSFGMGHLAKHPSIRAGDSLYRII